MSTETNQSKSDQSKGSFWTSLPGILTGIAAILAAVGTIVGLVLSHGPSHSVISTSSTTPAAVVSSAQASLSSTSAGQIANDVTGDTVNASRHSGASVTSATCYQSSVGQSGNGVTYAECDLTYSDGAVFRATVTDKDGNTSFQEQYQENLTAADIAGYAVGDIVTSGFNTGATVSSATCFTAELSSNGWTYATCDLDLSNGAVLDDATVADNGIRSEFQS
jgi:hypothetical protein